MGYEKFIINNVDEILLKNMKMNDEPYKYEIHVQINVMNKIVVLKKFSKKYKVQTTNNVI